jgi:aminoglycoside 6'-N-acetyltransferase I
MIIRPVDARDVIVWAAMRKRLWPDADMLELSNETVEFVTDPHASILDAAFIAEAEDGKSLGFIELSIRAFSDGCDSTPVPHIEGWYVNESARQNGIGRALMAAAEAWCVEHQFTELASDAELSNVASQHAHERTGFEEVERLVKFRKLLVDSA